MNKMYRLIWSTTQNMWIVCSELGKKGKSNNKKVSAISGTTFCVIILSSVLYSSHTLAICRDTGSPLEGVLASEGNVCSANSELYVGANTAAAYGNGSTLNFTQSDVEIIANAGSAWTLAIGASNVGGTTGVTPGATVNGINLKVVSSSAQNSRAIYIGGIDSNTPSLVNTLHVTGNLTAVGNSRSGGAAIQSLNAGVINVDGNTIITTRNSDAIRNNGKVLLTGKLDITNSAAGIGINNSSNSANFTVNGITTISSQSGNAILNASEGIVNFNKEANISNNSSSTLISNNNSTINILGNAILQSPTGDIIANTNNGTVNLTGDESTIQPTTGNGIVNSANGVVTIKNLKTATINGQDKAVFVNNIGKIVVQNLGSATSQGNAIQASAGEIDITNGNIVTQSDAIVTQTASSQNSVNLNNSTIQSNGSFLLAKNSDQSETLINVVKGNLKTDGFSLLKTDSSNLGNTTVNLDSTVTTHNGYWVDANGGTINANLANMQIQGLTQKNSNAFSNLSLNKSTWQLAYKDNLSTNNIASFSSLDLTNSLLIAHDVNYGNSTGTNTRSDFTLKGNVIASNSEIDMANKVVGDKLTIDGNYTTGNNTWLMD